jgi:small ligand-binding sensory domain FIST
VNWGSAVSRASDTAEAVAAAARDARRMLGAEDVDVALIFFSPHHIAAAEVALSTLRRELPGAVIAGCSAQSCIGGGQEVEQEPSLSLTLGRTPGASFRTFHVSPEAAASAGDSPASWRAVVGVDPVEAAGFILLGDPFSGDTDRLLGGVSEAYAGRAQIGGLASGGQQPGANRLVLGDEQFKEGHVGLVLAGDIALDTVVAQGCRPIGEPMFVTRSDQNVIFEVDGRPPLEVLAEIVAGASDRELALLETSLFAGVQMNPQRAELSRGDFLVRNVVGADHEMGALAIGALLEEGRVVQFQLRDGETAAEDLRIRLADHVASHPAGVAALLFSCLGRGQFMYGVPNHDSDAVRSYLGDISVAGFFGNGEIGPVEGKSFLHGYTSAIAIFRPRLGERLH